MQLEIEMLKRIEKEIRLVIGKHDIQSTNKLVSRNIDRGLNLEEVIKESIDTRPVMGALSLNYASGEFLSLDRVVRAENKFKKHRRIIYYLDSRPGQIGSSLLLELLKLPDNGDFSKHKFIQDVDESYFQSNKINISSGEINEALSRMFRKTLPKFFRIEGRKFIKSPFVLKMEGIKHRGHHSINYDSYKHEIDARTYNLVCILNQTQTLM